MGCESRIYVVNKYSVVIDGRQWGEVVAVYNACCFPGLIGVFSQKSDCFIIADDGNTEITEDRYGNELTEAPLSDVISFLENEIKEGKTYRRIKPLLGLLKSFDESQWRNLVCLHYGY